MDKLHTHYDNLKISRQAPQEVIRAAYKALSQKYHPDKNPGDEKAARIMAILNSAYGTLCDEQRRKEHDEWIAAEEWEIEWLESTRLEEARDGASDADDLQVVVGKSAPAYLRRRDPRWWLMMLLCLGVGGFGALFTQALVTQTLPTLFSLPATAVALAKPITVVNPVAIKVAPLKTESAIAVVSQISFVNAGVNCDVAPSPSPALAPNDEPWPVETAYLAAYPLGNANGHNEVRIDNMRNDSAIYAQLFDVNKAETVRHVYVKAHQEFLIDKLSPAKYQLRVQDLDSAALAQERCKAAAP